MARNTGFSPATRQLILDRAGGVCEAMFVEGCNSRIEAIHHRKPRKMGGSKRADINQASNGIAICNPCHQAIESFRHVARERGFLISQHNVAPASHVGVWRRGELVLLDDFGGVISQEVPW